MGDEGERPFEPKVTPERPKTNRHKPGYNWRPDIAQNVRIAILVEKLRTGKVAGVAQSLKMNIQRVYAVTRSATEGEWREAREIVAKQVRDSTERTLSEVYDLYYAAIKRLVVKAEEIATKAEGGVQFAKVLEAMTKVYQVFRGDPLPVPLVGEIDDKTVQREALCALVEGIKRSDAEFVEMGLKLTRSDYRAAERGGRGDVGLYERMAALGKTDGELDEEQEVFFEESREGKKRAG